MSDKFTDEQLERISRMGKEIKEYIKQKKEEREKLAIKRRKAQQRAYGSLNISSSVVKGYEQGRYSVDTLLNNIEKNNNVEGIYAEDWREMIKSALEEGGVTGLKNKSLMRNFWGEYAPEPSYKGALNEAFSKIDASQFETKNELYQIFGKNLNFMEWEYDVSTKSVFKIIDGVRFDISFIAGRKTGDYGSPSSILKIERTKVYA